MPSAVLHWLVGIEVTVLTRGEDEVTGLSLSSSSAHLLSFTRTAGVCLRAFTADGQRLSDSFNTSHRSSLISRTTGIVLVWRGLLHALDHPNFHFGFYVLQLQPDLLLKGDSNGRTR